MNPFSAGDRVYAKEKDRHSVVKYIMCGLCEKCGKKDYAECVSPSKDKVLVTYYDGMNYKRYKYNYWELELEKEEPTPTAAAATKNYDFSPKEIRSLGDAILDIPPIVDEDEELEEEISPDQIDVEIDLSSEDNETSEIEAEVEEMMSMHSTVHRQSVNQNAKRPAIGMFFDQFLVINQPMNRPV